MNITKRGKSWWIREMRNRKLISITIDHKPTRREALELIDQKELSVTKIDKSVFGVCNEYIKSKDETLSPSTVRGYIQALNRLKKNHSDFMDLDISEVTKLNFQSLINKLSSECSPKTVREYHSLIKASLDMYDISFKVTLPMRIKHEEYIPNDEDIKILLEHTKGSCYDVPIKLALNGLRRSEIMGLTMDDILDGKIKVSKAMVYSVDGLVVKSTKTTSSTREVIVSKKLTDQIKAQGYIYNGHIGNLSRYLKILHDSYGLPHYSLHKLRHYYASMMMTLGVPAPYIMEQGGWATDKVMKSVYTHTFKNTDFAEKGVAHIESITPL